MQRGTISAQKYLDLIENGLYKQDAGIKDYDTILEKLRTRDYEGAKKKYYADLSIYSKLSGFGYPIINIVVGGIQSNYKEYLDKPQAAYTQIYNKSPMEVRNFVKKLIEEQYTLYLQYQKNGWIQ